MADSDRVPDLMAVRPETMSSDWITDAPVVVVEIISPSTRTQDYVTKSAEYLQAGVGQYWIVDPVFRAITVLRNGGQAWEPIAELDTDNPTAEVPIGKYGTVAVSLDVLR